MAAVQVTTFQWIAIVGFPLYVIPFPPTPHTHYIHVHTHTSLPSYTSSQVEPNGEVVTHYLVKWCSLPYEDSTWELEEDVDQEAIKIYDKRNKAPEGDKLEVCNLSPCMKFNL